MFVTCFLYGGLGNQLFQLFATIAYSFKHNIPFKIIYTENLGNRPVYWGSFLEGLSNYLSTDIIQEELYKIKQQDGINLEAPDKTPIILDGYFQNPKFFEEFYYKISVLSGINRLQNDMYKRIINKQKNNISMHFRRGDYKELQHIHPIMPLEYYENALAYITAVSLKETYNVIYFCEEEDAESIKTVDIAALQKVFTNCVFRRFVGSSDWEEMLYMSCCDSHIIANSSFSWWGAFMNRRGENAVCYPGKWFGNNMQFPSDMFPENWTKIGW